MANLHSARLFCRLVHSQLRRAAIPEVWSFTTIKTTQCLRYSTARPQGKSNSNRKKTRQHGPYSAGSAIQPNLDDPLAKALARLQSALAEPDIDAVIASYGQLRGKFEFGQEDTIDLVKCLHGTFVTQTRHGGEASHNLATFARHLVRDIQEGVLPTSIGAHARLLHFFRSSQDFHEGSRLWRWLATQEAGCLSPNVYAAAILLFKDMGKPLPFLEELYAGAVKMLSPYFMEYHLSSNAKLSASTPQQIPARLLRAIASARLARGDIKSAYMTLDTQIRLEPTHVSALDFEQFIKSRPVSEAYPLYLMSCSYHADGKPFTSNQLSIPLLIALRRFARTGIKQYAIAARASITTLYASACVDSAPKPRHLAEVTGAALQILHLPEYSRLPASVRSSIADTTIQTATLLGVYFRKRFIEQNQPCLNSLIAAMGSGARRPAEMKAYLTRLRQLRAQHPSSPASEYVTKHVLITASGALRDAALLGETWQELVAQRSPTQSESYLYADAAQSCALAPADVATELRRFHTDDVVDYTIDHAARAKAKRDALAQTTLPSGTAEALEQAARQVHADVAVLVKRTAALQLSPAGLRDVPWVLRDRPSVEAGASAEEMRGFYEAVVLDGEGTGEKDKTADTLRWRNWRVLNELLAEAEWHGKVDEEIRVKREGNKDAGVGEVKTHPPLQGSPNVGLSDVFPPGGEESRTKLPGMADDIVLSVADVRRLRGLK